MKANDKRPHPRDYDDFIAWWDAVEKWEREQKRLKKQDGHN